MEFTILSKVSDGSCPGTVFAFQVRFGSDSEWPEGEVCIWFVETVPGSPEGRPGSNCQGRVQCAMVYERQFGEVGVLHIYTIVVQLL